MPTVPKRPLNSITHLLTPDSHTAHKYNLMFWQGYAFVWHFLDKFWFRETLDLLSFACTGLHSCSPTRLKPNSWLMSRLYLWDMTDSTKYLVWKNTLLWREMVSWTWVLIYKTYIIARRTKLLSQVSLRNMDLLNGLAYRGGVVHPWHQTA